MLSPLNYFLLDMQDALLDEVTPQLRAVSISVDEAKEELHLFFFYDGEITDQRLEEISLITVENGVSLSEYRTIPYPIQIDFPEKIPLRGKLAFLRKEPVLPDYEKENKAFLLKETTPIAVLLLAMQEALLGKVTLALRHVPVEVNAEQKRLGIYFVYDGEITEEDFALATSVIQEASASFPGYRVDSRIERVDCPNELPEQGERAVYMRKEPRNFIGY